MSIQSNFLYSQAVGAGLPFWRLEITNWGNRGAGADADSIAYTKPIKDSAAAIVIGPDSTVDQVIVGYNEVLNPGIAYVIPAPGNLNQISMTVGVKRPGFRLSGPLSVRTSYSTQFTDIYNKDGSPTNLPFGTAEPLFEAPRLQLLVYPTPPKVPIERRRNDMYRTVQTLVNGDIGAEELIGIWPVMGRGCKSLYFKAVNTGDLVATVRVGGIVDYVTTQVGLPSIRQVEKTVNNATLTVNAATGVTAQCTTGRPMQWIAAYVTRVSGTGLLDTVLIAEDC